MSYETTVLARSPALYIPANNGTLTDASGNGHDGTTSSALISLAGGVGALTGDTAIRFLPTATTVDSIALASPSTIPYVAPYTVEFWCKVEINGGEFDFFRYELVLPSGTPSGTGFVRFFAQEAPDPNMNVFAWINDGDNPPGDEFAGGPFADHPFCWHYYAFTYDGTTMRGYRDGAPIGTLADPAGMFSSTQVPTDAVLYAAGPMSVGVQANHLAVYGAVLSDMDVAANYAAATPRQDAGCFMGPIRLRHADGHVVFESSDEQTRLRAMDQDALTHDGTLMTVYSGGVSKLQVPIPSAPSPPTRWVGLDPAGGIAVHDILPVTATHGIAPVVPPSPVATSAPTCDPLRCGAATKMKDHLQSLYVNWARVLSPALKLAETFGVGAAIAALADLALDSAVLGPLAPVVWAAIEPVVDTLLTLVVPDLVPTLTPDQATLLINGAYCQLTCDGNVVNPTSAQVQAWNAYITAHAGSFASPSLQVALLNALLDFTPLLDWQEAAATATSSSACATMTCP